MIEVIMPIGIPGSGKTRLYKKRYSDYELVSVDLICKEIMGNMNDWLKDKYVFKEAIKKMNDLINEGKSIYFDNCNLYKYQREIILDNLKGKDVKVIYVVLPSDIEISKKRIEEDIKNNVERCYPSEKTIKYFMGLYIHFTKRKFIGENVQEIIYMKPEDLD